MTLSELNDYSCWLKSSPDKIKAAAAAHGGWKAVFPDKVPVWASKVRNYFNLLPKTLKRVDSSTARFLVQRTDNLGFLVECHEVQSANRAQWKPKMTPWGTLEPKPFKEPASCPAEASSEIKHMGVRESIALKSSLTGDVYLDDLNRVWYQMAAGSTIYHWGEAPQNPTLEAVYQDTVMGQNDTPVFKLVSPDGTGGSAEVIIFNEYVNGDVYNNRGTALGTVNVRLNVQNLTERDPSLQGSYNYSETTRVGLNAHEKRDVETHVPGPGFYSNPQDPYTALERRTFPVNDLQGRPLADQK